MVNLYILLLQLVKMLLFMTVGFCLSRSNVIKKGESSVLAQLLLYVVLPCSIINSFNIAYSIDGIYILATSIFCGVIALLIAILISTAAFKKSPTDNFSASFSNAGFMGIPLITSILGANEVFYIAGMVAMLNALQWTYGQSILSQRKNTDMKSVVKNPMVLAFLIGIVLYCLPITPPDILSQCLSGLAACNTPLAMIVLGLYLGESKLVNIFTSKQVYVVSAFRLLLIPAVTMVILRAMSFISYNVRLSILIAACAPVGSNVAIYAQKLKLDYSYAVSVVCCSTIFSIITIPIVVSAAQIFW